MRILHVAHQQWRKYGHNRVSWAQKLFLGLIKNGYTVQVFSDRDVAAFESPLGIKPIGNKRANEKLLVTVKAFEPDLIIVGHCDLIKNETLEAVRTIHPNTKITVCNNDPIFVPENAQKIQSRSEVADFLFVSSGESELDQFKGNRAVLKHMPNAVDASIEVYNTCLNEGYKSDLLFCSKETKYTQRGKLVEYLDKKLPAGIQFRTPGCRGEDSVWGLDYDRTLSTAKMALNLNRQEGGHWYSSARMAQLAGNGILTFTHASARFDELFPPQSLVYFESNEDLVNKIVEFNGDDSKRIQWASRARNFFHKELNSTLHASCIVETSMGLKHSHPYAWVS